MRWKGEKKWRAIAPCHGRCTEGSAGAPRRGHGGPPVPAAVEIRGQRGEGVDGPLVDGRLAVEICPGDAHADRLKLLLG